MGDVIYDSSVMQLVLIVNTCLEVKHNKSKFTEFTEIQQTRRIQNDCIFALGRFVLTQ